MTTSINVVLLFDHAVTFPPPPPPTGVLWIAADGSQMIDNDGNEFIFNPGT